MLYYFKHNNDGKRKVKQRIAHVITIRQRHGGVHVMMMMVLNLWNYNQYAWESRTF